MPDYYATVRTNPIHGGIDVLGVVGSKYEPVQNEASCELLDALTDESGAHFETAGALRGGRETFITMKLPNTMVFDGRDGSKDRTEFYLAALNSHDGSSAWRVLLTPVRIVCANTQSAAIGSAKASFSIRHTGGAKASIAEARAALKLSWRATSTHSRPRPPRSTPPRWTPTRCAASPTRCSRSTTPAPRPPCGTAAKKPAGSSNCGPARPPSPRSPAPGGRPTTRSPNISITSFLSAARGLASGQ